MDNNILGTESTTKLFVKYSLPAIISMVIAGTQHIIAGIFLGNYVGQNALASVNLVQPFKQVIVGFSMIISVGAMSYIGRTLGEGKKEQAQNIFKTALILSVVIGLILSICGGFYSIEIAKTLGANAVLLEGVATYIRIVAIFSPIMLVMYLFGFIDRVVGKPNLYLRGMIVSLLICFVLNYVLVKELGLGLTGTAYALGISYIGALLAVMGPMVDKNNLVNMFKGRFDSSTIFTMVYNGSSEGVIAVAVAMTAYLFNMTFMSVAGIAGVAAFTAINYVAQLGTYVMFGISDGIAPILSYNFGYKKMDRLNHTLKLAYRVNFVVGVTLFLVLFLFGKELVSVFVKGNVEVINFAVAGSKLYAYAFLLSGFNIINSGYFTAIGDARASIIISASRGLLFIAIGIVVLPMWIGLDGVWLTVPFAEGITFFIGLILMRKSPTTEKAVVVGNI